MRGLGECKIGGHTFVVRELTYPQVLQQIEAIRERDDEPTGLDWLFAGRYMPLDTLKAIVEEDVEAFAVEQELSPSEIEPLYKKAVEINPFLAGALTEMRRIATLMRMDTASIAKSLSEIFDGQPSSSSEGATTGPKSTDSPTSSKP